MAFHDAVGHVYRLEYAALEERLTTDTATDRDGDGRTLLMHAVLAEDASPRMVELLVRRGTPVDAADGGQRWTALHFAARDQKEAIVRTLLRAGATVDALDAFGNTPLFRCISDPYAKRGVVEALIEHGANANAKNADGISPLDIAEQRQRALVPTLRGEKTSARPYSPKTTFAPGQRLAHPQFGEGSVRKLLPDRKIEVEFADGIRALVHAR